MLKHRLDWIITYGLFKPDHAANLEDLGISQKEDLDEREPAKLAFRVGLISSYNAADDTKTSVYLTTGDAYVINVSWEEFNDFVEEVEDYLYDIKTTTDIGTFQNS